VVEVEISEVQLLLQEMVVQVVVEQEQLEIQLVQLQEQETHLR
tara:strand:- start:418 stop:546 length:129 start_codon:yes stop_codon:yes gene_type:complete